MRRKGNRSGMVMVSVLLMLISISVLTLSVLGYSVSQASNDQSKIDHIQAQLLAQGAFAKTYTGLANKTTIYPSSETLNGKNYTAVVTAPRGGLNDYTVSITY